MQSFDRALFLKPDYADALCNREAARCSLNMYKAALQSYEKAVRSSPDYEFQKGSASFQSAMKKVARIAKLTNREKIKKELDTLPPAIRTLPAVCNLRNANFAKTESSGRELVFYCFDAGEFGTPRQPGQKA